MSQILTKKRINRFGIAWATLTILTFLILWLLKDDDGERQVILSIFCFFVMGITLLWRLTLDELKLPLFNIGFILIFITIIYSVYPVFSYWMSDFQWTAISDQRMRSYKVTSSDMASFSLFHLSYIFAMIVGFLTIMKSSRLIFLHKAPLPPSKVSKKIIFSLFTLYILILIWFKFSSLSGISSAYIAQQIAHNLASVKFVIVVALFYVITLRWHKPQWRYLGLVFIFYNLILVLMQESGRTHFILLFIAFLMFYHKNVREFSFKFAFVLFSVLLAAFIMWGYVKTNLILSVQGYSLWSGSNEFTSLFGTAYDLHIRREMGILPEVPLYVRYIDIVLSIPSQFLSSFKWDGPQWYLEVIGLRGTGVGMMFGVISQGVIGYGIFELLVRGLITGILLGLLHNWYRKKSHLFWPNVIYVFIAVRSYYTYRAGTGYIFYDIFYQLIPAMALMAFMTKIIFYTKKNTIHHNRDVFLNTIK